jgi:hypothetical protein
VRRSRADVERLDVEQQRQSTIPARALAVDGERAST